MRLDSCNSTAMTGQLQQYGHDWTTTTVWSWLDSSNGMAMTAQLQQYGHDWTITTVRPWQLQRYGHDWTALTVRPWLHSCNSTAMTGQLQQYGHDWTATTVRPWLDSKRKDGYESTAIARLRWQDDHDWIAIKGHLGPPHNASHYRTAKTALTTWEPQQDTQNRTTMTVKPEKYTADKTAMTRQSSQDSMCEETINMAEHPWQPGKWSYCTARFQWSCSHKTSKTCHFFHPCHGYPERQPWKTCMQQSPDRIAVTRQPQQNKTAKQKSRDRKARTWPPRFFWLCRYLLTNVREIVQSWKYPITESQTTTRWYPNNSRFTLSHVFAESAVSFCIFSVNC